MDRKNITGTDIRANKSQKRGNKDYLEDKRRSKKRKFALVGEQWGDKKGTSGLNCKLGQEDTIGTPSTGPLLEPGPVQGGNNHVVGELKMEQKEQTQGGTNPSIGVINMEEVSKETGGEQEYNSSTGPLLDPGPGLGGDTHVVVDQELEQEEHSQGGTTPLVGVISLDKVGKEVGGGPEYTSSTGPLLDPEPDQQGGNNYVVMELGTKKTMELNQGGAIPSKNGRNHEGGGTKNMFNNDDTSLFDTAATVQILREDRGTCTVRRGWCMEHNALAKKITSKKKVWTKVKKTGLYKYCDRRLSVWRCDVNMENLLGTMEPTDGAGSNGSAGQLY